ncbi:MAG TPA: right-handed parallel beta-helix repeat-containing protein [Candidatus Polarisedimenticolia bacterium]|nr:right-handed parallel beta-helix repeat-containing protein [Candidatus Polarisedimenticolia bacterium]
MKFTALFIFGVVVCFSEPLRAANSDTINAADYGLREHADAGLALQRAVAACHDRGAHRLLIPPGVYELTPSYATEFYAAPSNNDQGLKPVALLLDGFDGLDVVATGAEFRMHNQMMAVIITHCRNVTLRGLTIDWDKLLMFEATVIATNAAANSFDIELQRDCVAGIVNGVLLHGEDPEEANHRWSYRQDLACCRFYDRANSYWPSMDPYSGDYAYQAWNPTRKTFARVEGLGNRRFRLIDATQKLPKVGWVMSCKGMRTPNRRSPAIWINDSTNSQLENVNIYYAGGMGVIAERSRDVRLAGVHIIPAPGSGRVISTTADATHFAACAGTIELADCEFANMFDDAWNVHGNFRAVDLVEDRHHAIVSAGHFQQVGHEFASAGDRICFSTPGKLRELQTATVREAKKINGYRLLLTLDEELAPEVVRGIMVENMSWQPDVHIHGCAIGSNAGGSGLLRTRGKILIENNSFYRNMERALGGGPDPGFWFESGALYDVTIRSNRFEVFNPTAPAMSFSGPTQGYNRNLLVEDNTIVTYSGGVMYLTDFDHVIFRNNHIESRATNSIKPGFVLNGCRDVEISGNTASGPQECAVNINAGCSNIRVEHNQGIASQH